MKKIFSLLAIGAIVLGMASCGDKNTPEVIKSILNAGDYLEGDFKIEVTHLTTSEYTFEITALDEEMYEQGYYYDYFNPEEYEDLYNQYGDNPQEFAEAVIKHYLEDFEEEGVTLEEVAEYYPTEDGSSDLYPGAVAYVIVFRFDENYELVGNISYRKITLPPPSQTIYLNLSNPLYTWNTTPYEYGVIWLKGLDQQNNIGLNLELYTDENSADGHFYANELYQTEYCVAVHTDTKIASPLLYLDLTGTENTSAQTYTFSGEFITQEGIKYVISNTTATFSDDAVYLYEYTNDVRNDQ
jgi:hypothetical protein